MKTLLIILASLALIAFLAYPWLAFAGLAALATAVVQSGIVLLIATIFLGLVWAGSDDR